MKTQEWPKTKKWHPCEEPRLGPPHVIDWEKAYKDIEEIVEADKEFYIKLCRG
mgnify:CR=1 FL=1